MDIDDKILDYQPPPLTEERMLHIFKYIKKNFPNQMFDFFSDFIRPSFYAPNFRQQAKLWKNFLIQHGYINEKEEIIYKSEDK